MAEFKKLSEVDLLETTSDNATVLVEESGEIKRVPKKEVGGAGGYIIHLGNESVTATGPYTYNCTDNYDELYDVLMAGGTVWIDYENAPEYVDEKNLSEAVSIPDATNQGVASHLAGMWFLTDIGLIVYDLFYFMSSNGEIGYILFPNGNHNLESGGR